MITNLDTDVDSRNVSTNPVNSGSFVVQVLLGMVSVEILYVFLQRGTKSSIATAYQKHVV